MCFLRVNSFLVEDAVSRQGKPKFNQRVAIYQLYLHRSLKQDSVTHQWQPKFNE
ncbi:MAG: hypothetical protein LDL41_12360 [Coleofasciculus sp. S288]|nr:hypothetical protein [Coleofasciculus sp. S288]